MSARPTTWGLAMLLATSALGACGGDSGAGPEAPRIPAAVAERLAGLSDETAAALELGDDCAAREVADELEREAARAEDEIPSRLRAEVRAGVRKLTASISCEPEPPPVVEATPEESGESSCPPGQKRKDASGDEDEEGNEGEGPGDGGKGKGKGDGKEKEERCEPTGEGDEESGSDGGSGDDGGGD